MSTRYYQSGIRKAVLTPGGLFLFYPFSVWAHTTVLPHDPAVRGILFGGIIFSLGVFIVVSFRSDKK